MNVAAAVTLEQRLRTLGYPLLVGRALDPRGVWEPEESMLVLGIARSDACAIGRDFGQAGFLYAGHDAVPRLVLVE